MPTMNRRHAFIVGMAALLSTLVLLPSAAQQQSQSPPPPTTDEPQLPTFRTGANLVRVDVTVLDHRGNPVPALKPEDFLIEEDGVPQKVSSLKFIEATGQPEDDLSLPIRSPDHAAAEAARDDVRVFLIFWDEYSIDQFGSTLRARDALTKLVTTAFQPTALVALMDQLTPTDAIRFTRDFKDLGLDVRKLRGRLGLLVPTRSAVEDAQLMRGGDIRRLRAEVTLSALKSAVVFLGTLREGRKAVIFFSEGVRGLGTDATTIMSDVVRAANESNTAIYTIDPRGLTGRAASDSLYLLANNTGGRTIANTNGLDTALRQIVREASAFYLLGYSSIRNPADGRFHQIKVRVDRPGLEVRSRRGYWAPSVKAVEDARAAAAAATPPDEVAQALAALTPATSRHLLDLWTGIGRTGEGRPSITLAWSPRSDRETGRDPPASVLASVTSNGDVSQFEGAIDQRGPTFPVSPGDVKVALTVRDKENRVVDTEIRIVKVPAVEAQSLAWSSPTLLRGRSPIEMRAINGDPNPPPFAGREFSRADRLLVRMSLFGDASDATVTSRLVGRQGRQLATLPIAPLAGRSEVYQIDLPLQSVAPGDYVIAVEASKGRARAETFVAIRVGG
jgi:VWFA-related protein